MSIPKVIVLLGSFSGGGSERAMINFSNGLIERGATVDVLVGRTEGPFRFLLSDKANVIELGGGMLKSIRKIRSHIDASKETIVFASQLHVNIAAMLSVAFKGSQHKVVLREATTPSKQLERATTLGKKALIRLSRILFKKADHIIAVSDVSKEDAIEFYDLDPKRITTVFAPFITEDFLKQADQMVHHPWFDEGFRVVTSMGRVMPVKDFGTLIKAFGLARKVEDSRLMIIGNTDRDVAYFSELQTLVQELRLEDYVEFVGFQSNPFPYLSHTHVYVLSSLFEGLPGSLVQALGLGCQIVSTDCKSGPSEILKGGSLGRLVPVGDHVAMSSSIIDALRSERWNGKTLEKVEEFTEKSSIEKLLSILRHL